MMTDDDIVTAAIDLARSVDHYEEVIVNGGQYADGVIEECFSLLLEYRDKLRGAIAVRTAALRDADELASYRDAAKAAYDIPTPVAAPPRTGDDAAVADEIQEARANLMAICDRMIDRQLMDEVAPVVESLRGLEARLRDSRGVR